MLLALGELVLGGVLIYAAFQADPDPRVVFGNVLGVAGAGKATKPAPASATSGISVGHGTQGMRVHG